MALFGAPIAHEDHAQRACYAALHLRESLRRYADELRIAKGISFAVRMGLNSGEVVVGRQAMTCGWTTRPLVTRRTWRRGWNRSRRPTRPISPSILRSLCLVTFSSATWVRLAWGRGSVSGSVERLVFKVRSLVVEGLHAFARSRCSASGAHRRSCNESRRRGLQHIPTTATRPNENPLRRVCLARRRATNVAAFSARGKARHGKALALVRRGRKAPLPFCYPPDPSFTFWM
jgi:hypothetical protein